MTYERTADESSISGPLIVSQIIDLVSARSPRRQMELLLASINGLILAAESVLMAARRTEVAHVNKAERADDRTTKLVQCHDIERA